MPNFVQHWFINRKREKEIKRIEEKQKAEEEIPKIEKEAYFLWEADGKQEGNDNHYWELAEYKIKFSNKEKIQREKDIWDKLEISGKIILSLFATFLTIFISIYTQKRTEEISFQNMVDDKSKNLVQALADRDKEDTNVRKDMFQFLLQDFLDAEDIKKQIAILEIIALNFQNRPFQIRPLFMFLKKKIEDDNKLDQKKLDYELRELSQDIAKHEVNTLINQGGEACIINIKKNDKQAQRCLQANFLEFEIIEVKDDYVQLKTTNISTGAVQDFKVDYFDSPFTDNTSIKDKLTYSVLIEELDAIQEEASLKVIIFPKNFFGRGTLRLQIDDLLGDEFFDKIQSR